MPIVFAIILMILQLSVSAVMFYMILLTNSQLEEIGSIVETDSEEYEYSQKFLSKRKLSYIVCMVIFVTMFVVTMAIMVL